MFPDDGLEAALRNIFDFDIHKQETIDFLYTTLRKHRCARAVAARFSSLTWTCYCRLQVGRLGIESVRDGASEAAKKIKDVSYKPTGSTDLKEPKFGACTSQTRRQPVDFLDLQERRTGRSITEATRLLEVYVRAHRRRP